MIATSLSKNVNGSNTNARVPSRHGLRSSHSTFPSPRTVSRACETAASQHTLGSDADGEGSHRLRMTSRGRSLADCPWARTAMIAPRASGAAAPKARGAIIAVLAQGQSANDAMNCLSDRERFVIEMYFGIDRERERTLSEIAAGLSERSFGGV